MFSEKTYHYPIRFQAVNKCCTGAKLKRKAVALQAHKALFSRKVFRKSGDSGTFIEMASFKIVVRKHHQRSDGKFPVSIRITHNRVSLYIPSGLYVSKQQINSRSFELKDHRVLVRLLATIDDYEGKLLNIDTEELRAMSCAELKSILMNSSCRIDFIEYCRTLIKENADKWKALHSALLVIEKMGITRLGINEFNCSFINRFKKCLDSNINPVYKPRTKNSYLRELCKVFRKIQGEYNTEYFKVIKHDPVTGLEFYQETVTKKKALEVDDLLNFISITPKFEKMRMAHDIMLLSFCLCGANVIDLLSMKKECYDPKGNRISYQRCKTKDTRNDGAWTSVRIEPEIEPIVKKYMAGKGSPYLFDFNGATPCHKSTRNIGMSITRLCQEENIAPISPYWFRHTWATIARNECGISKDDIDLCLVHKGNNPMADIYIKPDYKRIDEANRKVLDFVFGERHKPI